MMTKNLDEMEDIDFERCLTCGTREGVKMLATMDGSLPVCPEHVLALQASYDALEDD